MKQLFPAEITESTIESFVAKHNIKTQIIYTIIMVLLITAISLTFFVYVDVNVNSSGIAKTTGERQTISSPYSGLIGDILVTENIHVQIGDTLAIINSEKQSTELSKLLSRQIEVNNFTYDLNILTRILQNSDIKKGITKTDLYNQSVTYYFSQLNDLSNRKKSAELVYKRNKLLFEQKVIAPADFEPIEADYENSVVAIELLYKRQINTWHNDLSQYINESRDIDNSIKQIEIQISESIIKSPINGVIQKIEGVTTGSFVQAGQRLFEISPDSILYVECLIPPKDIGYLRLGQDVKMQIDAFNYNDWGLAEGKIIDIYNDVTLVQSGQGTIPVFKVLCSIETKFLELKNGYRGEIKRGMTVNARFKITDRTLFQLLYDKIDNWLNPNI